MQAKLIANLKNFGGDNVTGLMRLIPKNIRQATSGISSALSDPIDKLIDQLQNGANSAVRTLPQTTETTTLAKQNQGLSQKMKQRATIKGRMSRDRRQNE